MSDKDHCPTCGAPVKYHAGHPLAWVSYDPPRTAKFGVGARVRKRAKLGTVLALESMGNVFPETYRVKWDNGREDAGWRPDALEAA